MFITLFSAHPSLSNALAWLSENPPLTAALKPNAPTPLSTSVIPQSVSHRGCLCLHRPLKLTLTERRLRKRIRDQILRLKDVDVRLIFHDKPRNAQRYLRVVVLAVADLVGLEESRLEHEGYAISTTLTV
jgi:hypothetical protein